MEGVLISTDQVITLKQFVDESKKTWEIAALAIHTAVFQYSIAFISSAFAGHIGDLELAAVSVSENVFEGFVYGVMLGMGSALETLCGQAVGASKSHMLGIYMQRSCIITFVTALCLVPVCVFSSPLLQLFRQDKEISEVAGKFSVWVLPHIFAYAFNFPIQKFLLSQTKVWVMTIISAVAIVLHLRLNIVFISWLKMGLVGVALAGNISWWFIVIVQFVYVTSGRFPEGWTSFSLLAFKSLTSFIKLSLASAVMLCLELWYYTAVILMVGDLKNPKIVVDSISICCLSTWSAWSFYELKPENNLALHSVIVMRNPDSFSYRHSTAVPEWASVNGEVDKDTGDNPGIMDEEMNFAAKKIRYEAWRTSAMPMQFFKQRL
ncbi:hypothetical protein MLD38_028603 [Melastoma candidum]|uniref:Uncharacterized protein n=1 Tax=Melastoma candidum TaxID=119954 RepID=A0ACB9N7D6_9MYRT|nr:hypothetical protein MLD38_028603 [Melastoma candidum]